MESYADREIQERSETNLRPSNVAVASDSDTTVEDGDKKPSLKYRQHNINLTGSNRGIRNKFKRLIKFKNGSFSDWNEKNIKALNKNKKLLTIENQKTLHFFYEVRNSNLFIRVLYFFRSKIYRQSLMDQIGFFLGTIFNKI